jgi:hypothetical protein
MSRGKHVFRVFLIPFFLLLTATALADELQELRNALKQRGAKWIAGETSISRLSPEAKRRLFSKPPIIPVQAKEVIPVRLTPLPASIDWRNVNGRDYITSVKQQVGGSCSAFAATAELESTVLRMGPLQGLDLELSEHVITACPGGGGANLTSIAAFLMSTGLPLSTCYPWTPTTGDCSTACPGWQNKTYKLLQWHQYVPNTVDDIKTSLLQGPIITGMNVPPDFANNYTGGVYVDVYEAMAISQVTMESCTAVAKQAGFNYAGLQDGSQCFAGDTLGYARVADSECNMPCTANNSEMCGAAWLNSIYSTGLTGPVAYQGCYTDQAQNRALPIDLDASEGGHSIQIIGYDDGEQCFIGKNSWGTDWGEAGFFKIAYSEFKGRVVNFGWGVHTYAGAIGPPEPVIAVLPVDFSSGAPGTQIADVLNIGGQPLSIGNIAVQGADPQDFVLSSNTCSPAPVEPFQRCEVAVTFCPKAAGARSAQLVIASNDPDQPQTTVALSGTTSQGTYSYCGGVCTPQPVITSVSPSSGPFYGGTLLTVRGIGFAVPSSPNQPGTAFTLGGNSVPPAAAGCNGPQCVFTAPAGNPGTTDVVACVGCACSSITAADRFSYLGPTISSFSPTSGPMTGGTWVNMSGIGLGSQSVQVLFGSTPSTQKQGLGLSIDGVTALSPAVSSPGPVPIVVNLSGSFPLSSANMFTYEQYPRLIAMGYDAAWGNNPPGWIQLNGFAPAGGAAISLTSSDPSIIPSEVVTVPAGQRQGGFSLTIRPSPKGEIVTLTANYEGTTVSTNVAAQAWPMLTVKTASSRLAQGGSMAGTVILNFPPPSPGAMVQLSSSVPSVQIVPASVPMGSNNQGQFTVTSQYPGAAEPATITATYNGANASTTIQLNCQNPAKCASGTMWNQNDCACEHLCKPMKCPSGSVWNQGDCACELAQ